MSRLDKVRQDRLDKITKLQEQGINPYPSYADEFVGIAQAREQMDQDVTVVGRVMGMRGHGKLVFVDVQDESGQIQLMLKDDVMNEQSKVVLEGLDTGDFVEAKGTVGTSQRGEVSVLVKELTMLSKSLRPLPDQWYGLKDQEEKYRRRYVDMLINPETKQMLDTRWKTERLVREFLWNKGFTEVETPILQPLYGGTNAKPFSTYMNALDQDMYLRIAPELYLKRLIVGGYEKIFEIARNFRNEGIDTTHQPEFTMIEWYEAYTDYHGMMDTAEEMIKHLVQKLKSGSKITVRGQEIDIGGIWPRITMQQAIHEHLGMNVDEMDDAALQRALREHHLNLTGTFTRGKAVFAIFDHLVTDKLIQPTWIIDYPVDISPLTKRHRENELLTERYEGYIGGMEVCDGWTEITDAIDQRSRFENEQKNMREGNEEAHPLDEDFIMAMEYGMPPLGGIGMGIDRLVMFLTDNWSIREVIAFPTLRREDGEMREERRETGIKKNEGPPVEMQSSPFQLEDSHVIYLLSDEVKERFPGMKTGVAIIEGVHITKMNEGLEQYKQEVLAGLEGLSIEQISELPTIQAYRSLFRSFGVDPTSRRPSPDALLRRVAQGKGIYTINTLVDAYNLAVLETKLGMGAFDLDKVKLPVRLKLSEGKERVLLLGDESETEVGAGELIYVDQEKVITLDVNYRDADATKISDDTKKILLFVDGCEGISAEEVRQGLDRAVDNIVRFCGGEIRFKQVVE